MPDDAPIQLPATEATEAASSSLERTRRTLRALVANRSILRPVVAYGGYTIGEWGIWIAMLVYAFERGGATAAGVVALVQLAPSALLAPVVAGIGDRFRRERVLQRAYLYLAVTMAVTALALDAAAPVALVYVLAAITTFGITLVRPTHGSLLPSLAATPEELTAANVATGTIQNLGILVAPLLAGFLLAEAGPAAVFAVTAAIQLVGALLVSGVRVDPATIDLEAAPPDPDAVPTADTAADGQITNRPTVSLGRSLGGWLEGVRLLGADPATRSVLLLIAAGSVIEGALDVVAVVLALDLLDMGEAGVGLLGAAVGAGGLLGAGGAAALVGRPRLSRPFAGGLLLWGLPIAIVGLLTSPAAALLLFLAAGIGRSVMDVAGRTLLQRIAPEEALGRVFGTLEGLHDAMLAVGCLGVPVLIELAGPRAGLVLAGLWLPAVLVALARGLVRADGRAVVHVAELRLLRSRAVFAPLSPPTIERLAARLIPVRVPAGQVAIRQGDPGDRFYLIRSGEAAVDIDGRPIRTLGAGDDFGEIALVRNVPRTATVTAVTDLDLLALDRRMFLAAITGHPESRSVAEARVRGHLAEEASA